MTASKFNGSTSGHPISIPGEYARHQIFQSSGHRLVVLVSAGGQLLGRVWCNKDGAMWQLISTNTYGTNDPETKRCHRGTVISTSVHLQLLDSIVPIYLLSDTPLSTIYAAIQRFKKLKHSSWCCPIESCCPFLSQCSHGSYKSLFTILYGLSDQFYLDLRIPGFEVWRLKQIIHAPSHFQ